MITWVIYTSEASGKGGKFDWVFFHRNSLKNDFPHTISCISAVDKIILAIKKDKSFDGQEGLRVALQSCPNEVKLDISIIPDV